MIMCKVVSSRHKSLIINGNIISNEKTTEKRRRRSIVMTLMIL